MFSSVLSQIAVLAPGTFAILMKEINQLMDLCSCIIFLKIPKQKNQETVWTLWLFPFAKKSFCYCNVLLIVALQITNAKTPAVENRLCDGSLYMGMTLMFIILMLRQENIEII